MRPEAFDNVEILGNLDGLPLASRQTNSQAQSWTGFLAMGTLAALIVLPQVAIAATALLMPDVRAAIADRPLVALEIAIALVFWTALLCWPVRRMLMRMHRERLIELTTHEVIVTETRMFGSETWSEPVGAYTGLAHHVRSSLSGVRHELILVHPEPVRSVVMLAKDNISESEVIRLGRLLALPVVAASTVYSWGHRRPAASSVQPVTETPAQPGLAAAA